MSSCVSCTSYLALWTTALCVYHCQKPGSVIFLLYDIENPTKDMTGRQQDKRDQNVKTNPKQTAFSARYKRKVEERYN